MDTGLIIVSIIGTLTVVGITSLVIDIWIDVNKNNIRNTLIRNYNKSASKKPVTKPEYQDDALIINDYAAVDILDD